MPPLANAENPTVLFYAQRWRDAQVAEISEMETQLAASTGCRLSPRRSGSEPYTPVRWPAER